MGEVFPHPVGRIAQRQVELLDAGGQGADMPLRGARADTGFAQRRAQVGIFPLFHAAMRHTAGAEHRRRFITARFGNAKDKTSHYATSFRMCS